MERRRFLSAAISLSMAAALGCGSSSTSNSGAGGVAANAAAKPDEIVCEFLEAVRTGNDARAAQMLTEVARKETEKHELVVAPPGSDTAKFEVSETEFVSNELAHVASKWTDIGEDGQPHSDDIIWALRRDPAGWRIAGMATRIFPDEPPLLLDFENPEEMIQQQRMAEEEMQRRASSTATQATKATMPPDGNVLRQ